MKKTLVIIFVIFFFKDENLDLKLKNLKFFVIQPSNDIPSYVKVA